MSFTEAHSLFAGRADLSPSMRGAARSMVSSAILQSVTGLVTGAFGWLVKQHRMRKNIAALEALSDRMLTDIGIQRHDIHRVVRRGR